MNIVEFIQCHSSNYTKGRGGKSIKEMAVHYTATSASAHNNLVYFSRAGAKASAHLFVDKDGSIRQSVNFADTAWAVGNFARNQQSVSVEVVSAGEDFTAAQINALKEIYQYLKDKYGITSVIRHYDVTGKRCPAPYVNASKWATLKSQITGGAVVSGGSSSASKPASSGSSAIKQVQSWCNSNYGFNQAVDGINGPNSKKGLIRAYQTELNKQFGKGLSVDGIWGPKTDAAGVNVRKGASGNLTKVLQGRLICLGYSTGGFDGIFGGKTDDAVAAFQRANGLTVDRIAGKNTWRKLLG